MATKKVSKKQSFNNSVENMLALIGEEPKTAAVETSLDVVTETMVEDAQIIEEKTTKSDLVTAIKRRATNLDRFSNGKSSKFNADKWMARKLLALVPLEALEALNNELRGKLEKFV